VKTVHATFVFADIAGFTALTEAHGDEQAAELVARFCRAVADELPATGGTQVKTILHHGPAVERDGDYFGAAVNLAARVSAEASGGEVLLTGETAARAPELEGVLYEPRGRRTLRNVREPVELFAAVRTAESRAGTLPCDPVCRMAVEPDRAAGRLVYEDAAYFFCTLECAAQFAQHPERFARDA
jgi:adenylate cyclase